MNADRDLSLFYRELTPSKVRRALEKQFVSNRSKVYGQGEADKIQNLEDKALDEKPWKKLVSSLIDDALVSVIHGTI